MTRFAHGETVILRWTFFVYPEGVARSDFEGLAYVGLMLYSWLLALTLYTYCMYTARVLHYSTAITACSPFTSGGNRV
jgi:hypothetical protein